MSLPASIAAYGWIPFLGALAVILLFSTFFIRHHQSSNEYETSSSIVAVFALVLTLSTSALLPLDVFLVSWMKTANGTFQDWAQNSTDRQELESDVMTAYYALYGTITLTTFLLLPLAYFYYEERDDDRPWRPRLFNAMKYAIGFVVLAGIILLTGAFIPLNDPVSGNGTVWDDLRIIVQSFEKNGGQDAISFMVSILCVIGMLFNALYTGFGMASWPVNMMRGSRSIRHQYEDVVARRAEIRRELTVANSRLYPNLRNREIQERERLLARQERELEPAARSRVRAFLGNAWRPFQILLGFSMFLLAGLIAVSLLLTNIDKAMHSHMRFGYILPRQNRTLPNPIDWVLVKSQQLFPLDFIFYGMTVAFLLFVTVMAVKDLGLRCFCVRLFRFRPHGTRPQGILFLCFILTFSVLGLNVISYFLSPQYSTFGSQHYRPYVEEFENLASYTDAELKPCEEGAIDCEMTRNSYFLVCYFFKAWFFGACYYWLSWGILVFYVIGLLYSLARRARGAAEEAEEDSYDDLE
ncbi:hypothetical protein RvY_12776 [Ramazzottius varieornatus]|uniref:Lysosomal cobalamin transporter n=1 Tax=Ramazzottius varieornatus TaxID=947166 RepID=A0A1D1VUB8_RAMVA|nr:hypothetical protein RvY_12776 [Ramazzottius varieornatus]